jgi:hypothetical protein
MNEHYITSAAAWAASRSEIRRAHSLELDKVMQKHAVLEMENRTKNARIDTDNDKLKTMASKLAYLEKEFNQQMTEPAEEEITALSDDDDVEEDADEGSGVQRSRWLIRHTGSKRLTCNIFWRPRETVPLVDEIVSLKDDIGTTYTSFVYAGSRVRATSIEKVLRCTVGVSGFKVIEITNQMMIDSDHFQKLIEAVRSKDKNIKIDTLNQLTHFNRIFGKMFLR